MVVAALAIGVALFVRAAGHSDEVTLADVLARYRSAPSAGRAGPPQAGVYTYRVRGHEAGGAGPFRIGRDLPELATTTVTRFGDGWQTETRLSRQHVEGARFVVTGGAVRMVWRREDVTFAGVGRDDRRDLVGTYRVAPLRPTPGIMWRDEYLAGSLRNVVTTTVGDRERLDVDGTVVPTIRIDSRTTTTGALSGTRVETVWWSTDLRIAVRVRQRIEIDGVFGYEATLDMALTGVRPTT